MTDALTTTITAAKRVILSVGSGDGSQQAAIIQSGHHNIISTFFDGEQAIYSKYETSRDHISLLRKKSTVLFGVDATKLHGHPELQGKKFNIIMFTFPHTGVPNFANGRSGPNPKSVEGNKQLIRGFLRSAQHLISNDGEINITLKTSAPYDQWTFPDFAQYEIESKSQHNFDDQLFPGYIHRSTKGHVKSVNNGRAKTFVFGRKGKHQDEEKDECDGIFCPISLFTLSIEFAAVDDHDIEEFVIEMLSASQNTKCNVLDIRRQFPEAVRPDTRQLNRVLYQMESSNKLKRGPPKGSSQKPTWKLIAG